MADIDIVPKRRSKAWLWVLLVIAVLFILWMLMPMGTVPPQSSLEAAPAGLAAYDGSTGALFQPA